MAAAAADFYGEPAFPGWRSTGELALGTSAGRGTRAGQLGWRTRWLALGLQHGRCSTRGLWVAVDRLVGPPSLPWYSG